MLEKSKHDTSKRNLELRKPKKQQVLSHNRVPPTVESLESPDCYVDYTAPLIHVMFAGGIGGSTADFLMHSIDTVKTRLQGQKPIRPLKYQNMLHAYITIFKQEGITRGLYSGVTPAILGSVPATTIYFGIYELTKRKLTAIGIPDTVAHLTAGSVGDVMASTVYVPSEVLKTRLQLQGRYNNPHFFSGYNYKNTWHAAQMLYKYEGPSAFYHGYKATLLRDVPFSALQFAFYEKFKLWATFYANTINQDSQLSLKSEIATGALAGGLAGALTTPLDVMKTILQTQVQKQVKVKKAVSTKQTTPVPPPNVVKYYTGVWEGIIWNYKNLGIKGLFIGIGPRVAWTAMQSGIMFFIYEQVLGLLVNNISD
ncbi:mitochondrial carrier domain-containing protein [Gigaspora rosea]|uniref:Mitochondrial carrier domain-containing protein n=1 Tax=Gigaspora rosea TaxID=44941 RepID=A0A397UGC6_9GLOM|nr:mitochondrial carrier domain-containing protein [Gigaspora rosea]